MKNNSDLTGEVFTPEELKKADDILKAGEADTSLPESISPQSIQNAVKDIKQMPKEPEKESKAKRDKRLAIRALAAVAAVAVAVTSAFIVKPWRYITPAVVPSQVDSGLKTAGDYAEIEKLFCSYAENYRKSFGESGGFCSYGWLWEEKANDMESGATKAPGIGMTGSSATNNTASGAQSSAATENKDDSYGKTNEQVEGVSEADIIKNDGKYIYTVLPDNADWDKYYTEYEKYMKSINSGNDDSGTVEITTPGYNPNAVTASDPDAENDRESTDSTEVTQKPKLAYTCAIGIFEPQKDGKFTESGVINIRPETNIEFVYMKIKEMYVTGDKLIAVVELAKNSYYGSLEDGSVTMSVCFDISDRSNALEEWRVFQDGAYVSSRLIGDEYIAITDDFIPLYGDDETIKANCVPKVGTDKTGFSRMDCSDLCIMEDIRNSGYTVVSALDINDEKTLNTKAVLGGGENVYCTAENLYVTSSCYDYGETDFSTGAVAEIFSIDSDCVSTTSIMKFSIKDFTIKYLVSGSVTGTALNQFSIDEYDGNLRIATTTGSWSENLTNQVYVLDKNLETLGVIKGIAKGETIKSVRFTGDTGYVVTFEQTDPLFVIDLSNPNSPKITGELKITGFSAYLHPVTDNLLLGIGVDGDEDGQNSGMKISLFDVSDKKAPKEAGRVVIEGKELGLDDASGYYSYITSESYYNHKAVCYDKNNSIMYITYNKSESSFSNTETYESSFKSTGGILAVKIDTEKGTLTKVGDFVGVEGDEYGSGMCRTTYTGDVIFGLDGNSLVSFNKATAEKADTFDLSKVDVAGYTKSK